MDKLAIVLGKLSVVENTEAGQLGRAHPEADIDGRQFTIEIRRPIKHPRLREDGRFSRISWRVPAISGS